MVFVEVLSVAKSDYKDFYMLSDEECVEVARSGNEEALNHIIARYRNYVYSKANTYFLVGADKDDVVQEGLIGLYKAAREYDPSMDCSFKHFAGICISRQIITAIKAATRKKHVPLNSYISLDKPEEYENEETFGGVMEAENPEDIVISQENLENIECKITNALSKMEMQVFMYYTQGMSYDEIASLIQKPVKSVDNALCRIKKKLLSELK